MRNKIRIAPRTNEQWELPNRFIMVVMVLSSLSEEICMAAFKCITNEDYFKLCVPQVLERKCWNKSTTSKEENHQRNRDDDVLRNGKIAEQMWTSICLGIAKLSA